MVSWPYFIHLIFRISGDSTLSLVWTMPFCLVSMVPLTIHCFRLASNLHGKKSAIAHCVLLVVLTPAFLAGLICVPLLLKGDAKRLFDI